jgi:hypothetical protein
VLAAVLAVVGTPLVARALGDDAVVERDIIIDASIDADPATAESLAGLEAESSGVVLRDDTPDPVVDPMIVLLADTYSWDERSARVTVLQTNLGVAVDGVYGLATQHAHRNALEFVGLPLDTLPAVVLPPGPSAAEWESLRWCESNGNYEITNPSGKYRGAYQFDRPTWNSVAERHAPHLVGTDPAAASPADQDFMALALYSERGARPWPQCGRHLS